MSIRRLVHGLLILLVSVAALSGRTADAEGFEMHPYVFIGVGEADIERRLSVADVIDGDDDAYAIGAGFALNRYLSVEGSYQRFGKPDGFVGCPVDVFCIAVVPFAREDVEVDGWTAGLRGSLPVTDRLSVFARASLLAWETSARSAADITDRLALQVSYEEANVDISTLKLGLLYRL